MEYNKSQYNRLKYKFPGSEYLERNYSQSWQDMFILTMLEGKRNGTFVEIGAYHPTLISNTYLLDMYGWAGISIDFNPTYEQDFKSIRNCTFMAKDALKIDYCKLFIENSLPNVINYLQLDIDPYTNTFECLKLIPFDKYKFSVITYETDFYRESSLGTNLRDESRKIIMSHGYKLVVGNISNPPFEDWYAHPDLVSSNVIKMFESSSEFNAPPENLFLK